MSLLSQRDKWMFAKYYGRRDLACDEEFWTDVLTVYMDNNVPLPMPVRPEAVRQFFDGFKCARCGACCKYLHTNISAREISRISESSARNAKLLNSVLEDYEGGKAIAGSCPFLKHDGCSIYHIRPHTCYFFPLQMYVGPEIDVAGTKQKVMFCRVKCPSSVKAIRLVIADMLKQRDTFILLPNLNIIDTGGKLDGDSETD